MYQLELRWGELVVKNYELEVRATAPALSGVSTLPSCCPGRRMQIACAHVEQQLAAKAASTAVSG
jgi:hypothetical protein